MTKTNTYIVLHNFFINMLKTEIRIYLTETLEAKGFERYSHHQIINYLNTHKDSIKHIADGMVGFFYEEVITNDEDEDENIDHRTLDQSYCHIFLEDNEYFELPHLSD